VQEIKILGLDGNLLQDREPFFELDGEQYTIPKKIPSRVALQVLEKMEAGDADLTQFLLDEVLGEGAYDALRDSDSVSMAELAWVFEQVNERALGELEKAQGKSRNGSRRSAGS
jgi:hypothetical protein